MKEHRNEFDSIKALLKNNKDKLSFDLFKNIELQIDNFGSDLKVIDQKYEFICNYLNSINTTTQNINKFEFEYERIFDQNNKIKSEIIDNMDSKIN